METEKRLIQLIAKKAINGLLLGRAIDFQRQLQISEKKFRICKNKLKKDGLLDWEVTTHKGIKCHKFWLTEVGKKHCWANTQQTGFDAISQELGGNNGNNSGVSETDESRPGAAKSKKLQLPDTQASAPSGNRNHLILKHLPFSENVPAKREGQMGQMGQMFNTINNSISFGFLRKKIMESMSLNIKSNKYSSLYYRGKKNCEKPKSNKNKHKMEQGKLFSDNLSRSNPDDKSHKRFCSKKFNKPFLTLYSNHCQKMYIAPDITAKAASIAKQIGEFTFEQVQLLRKHPTISKELPPDDLDAMLFLWETIFSKWSLFSPFLQKQVRIGNIKVNIQSFFNEILEQNEKIISSNKRANDANNALAQALRKFDS